MSSALSNIVKKIFIKFQTYKLNMYPHAHFMAAILGAVFGYKYGYIHFYDILLTGILAVIIDFDHYLLFFLKHRTLNPIKFWNKMAEFAVTYSENPRSFIHRKIGMLIIFPIIGTVYLLSTRIGFILFVAYGTHMLLDHLHKFNKTFSGTKIVNIFGMKVAWDIREELLFVIMTGICIYMLI